MINLKGKSFGDWTVLRESGRTSDRRVSWLCECACGTKRKVNSGNLMHGGSLGCGCTKKGLRLRPFESLYRVLRKEAIRRGIEFRLTYEGFLLLVAQKSCSYCGCAIKWSEYRVTKNGSAYNLDRKNNSLGYSRSNCVVCCSRCNRAKSDHFTYDEWKKIGGLIRTWRT
jgi:hypothetical protein